MAFLKKRVNTQSPLKTAQNFVNGQTANQMGQIAGINSVLSGTNTKVNPLTSLNQAVHFNSFMNGVSQGKALAQNLPTQNVLSIKNKISNNIPKSLQSYSGSLNLKAFSTNIDNFSNEMTSISSIISLGNDLNIVKENAFNILALIDGVFDHLYDESSWCDGIYGAASNNYVESFRNDYISSTVTLVKEAMDKFQTIEQSIYNVLEKQGELSCEKEVPLREYETKPILEDKVLFSSEPLEVVSRVISESAENFNQMLLEYLQIYSSISEENWKKDNNTTLLYNKINEYRLTTVKKIEEISKKIINYNYKKIQKIQNHSRGVIN